MEVLLSTGRTIDQGVGKEKGKHSDSYSKSASVLQIDGRDMKKIDVSTGDTVKLRTEYGEVKVEADKSPDTPHEGIVFLPVGPWANALTFDNTSSQGMPEYTNLDAIIEKAKGEITKAKELIG